MGKVSTDKDDKIKVKILSNFLTPDSTQKIGGASGAFTRIKIEA